MHILLARLQLAVNTLEDPTTENFVMEGHEVVGREQLLHLVSQQYNCQPHEYCSRMRLPTTWGGGPEILALAHALRRPIAVYTFQTGGSFAHPGGWNTADCSPPQQTLLEALLRQQQGREQRQQEALLRLCKVFGWTQESTEEPIHLLFASAQGIAGEAEGEANHFAPLYPVMPP